jgi:hypothetical protein
MKYLLSVLSLVGFIGLCSSAHATDITVPNFSFEDSYYSDPEGAGTAVTDWIYSNPDTGAYYGTQDNDNQFNNTGTTQNPVYGVFVGSQYLFMNMTSGGQASITSAASLATIQAGKTYTLTVGVGNHLEPDDVDYGQPGNQTISLLANGLVISNATLTVLNGTLSNGQNADYSVSFTAAGLDAGLANEALTIELSDNAFDISVPVQAAFDNVRLVETPEPGTWAMMLVGLTAVVGFGYRRARA